MMNEKFPKTSYFIQKLSRNLFFFLNSIINQSKQFAVGIKGTNYLIESIGSTKQSLLTVINGRYNDFKDLHSSNVGMLFLKKKQDMLISFCMLQKQSFCKYMYSIYCFL